MHSYRAIPVVIVAAFMLLSILPQSSTAQVVQIIDPTNPIDGTYSYAVKFVCGFQRGNTGLLVTSDGLISSGEPTVKAGNYATDINIYNPGNDVEVQKKVLFLVEDGIPVGREPKFVEPRAFDEIGLPSCTATMDDCNRINELAPPSNPFALRIGYFVITAKQALDVTAVYTAELCSDWLTMGPGSMCSTPPALGGFSTSISIDVEQIDAKFIPQ